MCVRAHVQMSREREGEREAARACGTINHTNSLGHALWAAPKLCPWCYLWWAVVGCVCVEGREEALYANGFEGITFNDKICGTKNCPLEQRLLDDKHFTCKLSPVRDYRDDSKAITIMML